MQESKIMPQNDLTDDHIWLVNKPLQWTSFDVVKKLKHALGIKKIGHAGTLDPLATGLLIVCSGKNTKKIVHYQELEKSYHGQLVIGKTTPSIDLETPFNGETNYQHVTKQDVLHIANSFLGIISQVPPAYSAIKVQGKRAYKAIRAGAELTLLPREVCVNSFTLTNICFPAIDFEINCSKGTYIRSLVRDFGEKLGTGAYLSSLCRVRIGPYRLEDAAEINQIVSQKSMSKS